MQSKIIVLTSDKGNWLLPGFLHQWQKYDGRPLEVWGYTDPGLIETDKVKFCSIGNFTDYPMSRWSDGVIKAIESIPEELLEVYLEDYWLMRKTNHYALGICRGYMARQSDAARFDLGTDRLYAKTARDVESIDTVDIIEAGGDYAFSWQASIWRKRALQDLMIYGETAWESELAGTNRLNQSGWRVLGSRQCPVRYMIAVNKGMFDRSGSWMYPPRTLSQADWWELDRLGYTQR